MFPPGPRNPHVPKGLPETPPEPVFDKALHEKFMSIGFDDMNARLLMGAGVNVDKAISLVKVRGCPVELALKILL